MKKFKTAVCLLMLLSVAITAIILQFMPDIIPAHYNMAGEVDRLGSICRITYTAFFALEETGVL